MEYGNGETKVKKKGQATTGAYNPVIPTMGGGYGGGGQLPNIPYGGMRGGGGFNMTPPTGVWGQPGGGGRAPFDWGNLQRGIGGGPLMPPPTGGGPSISYPPGMEWLGGGGGGPMQGPGVGGGPFLNPINPGMGGMEYLGGAMRGGTPGGPFNPYLPGAGAGQTNPWIEILRRRLMGGGGGGMIPFPQQM